MPDTLAFTMPSLGADMDAGTVLEWLIGPGSVVHRGDIVAVVETDKSEIEVEVFTDGTVSTLQVPVGVKVPVGTVLATLVPIGSPPTAQGTAQSAPAVTRSAVPIGATAPPEPIRAEPTVPASRSEPPPRPQRPLVLSPVVRHLAEQLHIETRNLHGSGAGGQVTRGDVEHAAVRRVTPRARRLAREHRIDLGTFGSEGIITGDQILDAVRTSVVPTTPSLPAPEAPPRSNRRSAAPSDSMRRTIARLMVRSWQEIPHYQVSSRIDLRNVMARLDKMNAQRPAAERILPAAVMLQAAARAAARVPAVNGQWVEDRFVPDPEVHLGIVVALRSGGLLAPVIRDAAAKDLESVMAELRDLVTRARTGRLRGSEIGGATFTVTDLGDGGAESVSPIIHPPQVAILGLGGVHDEPWAADGAISVRPIVRATLAGDHRAIDGRIASLYLTHFARCLEEAITP